MSHEPARPDTAPRGPRALAAAVAAGGALSLAALLLGQSLPTQHATRDDAARAVVVVADPAALPDTTVGTGA
jgi:hypothetical protein